MLKPYSLLMYILGIIAFFILGIVYAGITDAGKGQMLAGGAIVLGYGVIGAVSGLCLVLILAYKTKRDIILKINGLLALIIIASVAYFTIKYQKRQQAKEQQKIEQQQPESTTDPVDEATQSQPFALQIPEGIIIQAAMEMGLAMFTPNFFDKNTRYFCGNIISGKSVQEHMQIAGSTTYTMHT